MPLLYAAADDAACADASGLFTSRVSILMTSRQYGIGRRAYWKCASREFRVIMIFRLIRRARSRESCRALHFTLRADIISPPTATGASKRHDRMLLRAYSE